MPDDDKTPVDALVELMVFAPLGLALTARDNLPDLIAKGRTQFTNQVTMARMVGQFAVSEGDKELRKRLEGVAETLSALGILPEQARPQPAPAPAAPTPPAAAAPAPAPEATATPATPAAAPGPSSEGLAIPGYDTLSASQVVQRLAGLSADELDAVRAYESAHRGRRTILSKISQLAADPGR